MVNKWYIWEERSREVSTSTLMSCCISYYFMLYCRSNNSAPAHSIYWICRIIIGFILHWKLLWLWTIYICLFYLYKCLLLFISLTACASYIIAYINHIIWGLNKEVKIWVLPEFYARSDLFVLVCNIFKVFVWKILVEKSQCSGYWTVIHWCLLAFGIISPVVKHCCFSKYFSLHQLWGICELYLYAVQ